MSLHITTVPIELLLEILSLALHEHRHPSDILCVNRQFSELGQHLLHSHLRFRTVRQIALFAEQPESARLACAPKALTVTLSGGTASFDVFLHLAAALRRCRRLAETCDGGGPPAQVSLDLLSLCLHSHRSNPNLHYIYDALSIADPKTFVWIGPDPDHHFSTAIVPEATFHLFRAIRKWSSIAHITLTNLSFPPDELDVYMQLSHVAPLLPVIPSLRTLSLGQATFLNPSAIAAMVCSPGQDKLELVRLVDAYSESIWGPRIRRGDVEKAALALGIEEGGEIVDKVRRTVRCEGQTERIVGGDRIDWDSFDKELVPAVSWSIRAYKLHTDSNVADILTP